MSASVDKLARKLKDRKLATALVAAGLDNPAKIRAASDEVLERVKGVGKDGRKAIRARVKVKQG